MTDFRALCARIADELDHYRQLLMDDRREVHALAAEARAALVESQADGPPTVMQIIELADEIEAAELGQVDLVRAALARWGRPAAQPVPVSERLPGPRDCDAKGRCWWYGEGGDMVGWTYQDSEGLSYYRSTHWLPVHALPVPSHK